MTIKTKLLLALSLIAFALGFTDLYWGVGKPVGAILLGLFMIFKVLEKEAALFDQEQSQQQARAEKLGEVPATSSSKDLRGTTLATRGV